jgi:hypothetical protein
MITIIPDPNASHDTSWIAAFMLNTSATNPIPIAPNTNPKSLQNL